MASTSATSTSSTNPGQTLTEANFLQLLVTQMSSQDPLDPQSDTEFAAQLAQFSSLQESQTMQANLATLQANSMIGETVSVTPAGGGGSLTGVVSGVQVSAGTPYIVMNGQGYALSQVTAIAPATVATGATPAQTAAAPAQNTPTTPNN